jgi:hypothetical protein
MTLETSFYDVRGLTATRDAVPRFASPQRREAELRSVIRTDLSSAAPCGIQNIRRLFALEQGSVPSRGTKFILYQHV